MLVRQTGLTNEQRRAPARQQLLQHVIGRVRVDGQQRDALAESRQQQRKAMRQIAALYHQAVTAADTSLSQPTCRRVARLLQRLPAPPKPLLPALDQHEGRGGRAARKQFSQWIDKVHMPGRLLRSPPAGRTGPMALPAGPA